MGCPSKEGLQLEWCRHLWLTGLSVRPAALSASQGEFPGYHRARGQANNASETHTHLGGAREHRGGGEQDPEDRFLQPTSISTC